MDDIKRMDLIDIELNSGTLHRSWCKHSIGTADALANAFGVRVFRDGEAVNLEGGSVQGYFRDPQGNNIAITGSSYRHIDDNIAYIILPQACYNYEGQFTLAIKLINSSAGITGTMRIVDGMVDNTNTGSAVAPTGEVPTYEEVLSVYEEMLEAKAGSVRFDITQSLTAAQKLQAKENIEAAGKGMVSEYEYDPDTTYSAGEYCIWNGQLRRSQVDGNIGHTPGANTTTYWAVCTAMGQIKTAIEDIAQPYDITVNYSKGDYISRNRKILKANKTTGDGDFVSGDWDEVEDIANDLKVTVELISGIQYRLVI